MSFQKCPVCDGKGFVINTGGIISASSSVACEVCGGARIIDENTGLPPSAKAVPTDDQLSKINEYPHSVEPVCQGCKWYDMEMSPPCAKDHDVAKVNHVGACQYFENGICIWIS